MKTVPQKSRPKLYLVTAVHNNLSHTKKLLGNIHVQSHKPNQIIVVDDGSTDGTSKFIKERYPEVVVIKGDGNLWWTKSLFLAIKQVLRTAKDKDFVLTINNDCSFSKEYLETIYQVGMRNPGTIVGSLVLDKNNRNKIWDAGVKIDWVELIFISTPYQYLNEIPRGKEVYDWPDVLSTKGTLFPIEIFRKIGNFNYKQLPHYHSDYEYTCRAKKHGFKLLVAFNAKLFTDTKNTGIGDHISKDISFAQGLELLLSRRSKINLLDGINLIRLCCPKKYRLKNYLHFVSKIIKNFPQRVI